MKCKDFYIIKIRYYADENLLKKCHSNEPLPTQHMDRAKTFTEFRWQFIEKMTGQNSQYWYTEYPFETIECAFEYIEEKFDIRIHKGEGWETFWIPKTQPEIFEWIKENCKNPYRELQKSNTSFWSFRSEDKTWRRKMSNDFKNRK